MDRKDLFAQLDQSLMAIGKDLRAQSDGSLDCSPAQKHVLLVLGMHDAVHVKQLAELLHVTSGAATQHVDALEKRGLVERDILPDDRRIISVHLTEAGKIALRQLKKDHDRLMHTLFAALTDSELETLVTLISKASRTFVDSKQEGVN